MVALNRHFLRGFYRTNIRFMHQLLFIQGRVGSPGLPGTPGLHVSETNSVKAIAISSVEYK